MALLERDSQLRAAAGWLAEAVAGDGRLVFVAGEAGVGKTAFVQRVAARAGASARVAVGACDSVSTPAPLGPLAEMLAALPGRAVAGGGVAVRRLHRADRRAPGAAAGGAVPVVGEDAHWADEASLDLVRLLGRRERDSASCAGDLPAGGRHRSTRCASSR